MITGEIIQQMASFFTRMGIPYKSIKMYANMFIIHATDKESAEVIESILNKSGMSKVSVTEEEDGEHVVTGTTEDDQEEA